LNQWGWPGAGGVAPVGTAAASAPICPAAVSLQRRGAFHGIAFAAASRLGSEPPVTRAHIVVVRSFWGARAPQMPRQE
jgi:hypothetical protein